MINVEQSTYLLPLKKLPGQQFLRVTYSIGMVGRPCPLLKPREDVSCAHIQEWDLAEYFYRALRAHATFGPVKTRTPNILTYPHGNILYHHPSLGPCTVLPIAVCCSSLQTAIASYYFDLPVDHS